MGFRPRDRGQATILMAAVVACCALAAIAVGELGGALVDRQQARTSADAAALAGVDGGRDAAERLAELNGGRLVSYAEEPGADGARTVEVAVVVDGVTARARASNGP